MCHVALRLGNDVGGQHLSCRELDLRNRPLPEILVDEGDEDARRQKYFFLGSDIWGKKVQDIGETEL
jgi:hypothetical protein